VVNGDRLCDPNYGIDLDGVFSVKLPVHTLIVVAVIPVFFVTFRTIFEATDDLFGSFLRGSAAISSNEPSQTPACACW
jgi:hypothetical protein